jgi:hypothetical protein
MRAPARNMLSPRAFGSLGIEKTACHKRTAVGERRRRRAEVALLVGRVCPTRKLIALTLSVSRSLAPSQRIEGNTLRRSVAGSLGLLAVHLCILQYILYMYGILLRSCVVRFRVWNTSSLVILTADYINAAVFCTLLNVRMRLDET